LPPLDPRAQAAALVAPFRDLYPFEHHFLETGAGRLHYVDEGQRDAPPLLCVHGNPSWSILFRHLITGLSDSLRCVAIDHLGCGLSDQPDGERFGYRLADHARNLERLVLELDLERITLVVHDWGGPIGWSFAARHPGRIARLVVTNTSLFPAQRIPARIALCRVPLLGPLLVGACNGFARAATRMAVARPMGAQLRRAYVAPYARPRSPRATLRFVQDIPMDPAHPSRADLEAVAAALPRFGDRPALILWGERDWCFTPAFREELARRLPQAEVHVLEEASHYLFEDAPQKCLSAVSDFLQRNPLP